MYWREAARQNKLEGPYNRRKIGEEINHMGKNTLTYLQPSLSDVTFLNYVIATYQPDSQEKGGNQSVHGEKV